MRLKQSWRRKDFLKINKESAQTDKNHTKVWYNEQNGRLFVFLCKERTKRYQCQNSIFDTVFVYGYRKKACNVEVQEVF